MTTPASQISTFCRFIFTKAFKIFASYNSFIKGHFSILLIVDLQQCNTNLSTFN